VIAKEQRAPDERRDESCEGGQDEEGDRCPACAEVALLARFEDAYTPEPAPRVRPVALPHQWDLASGCVGYVCRHCGVRRTGQETIMCPSRLEVRR
jgi:hypothetical protein